MTFAEFAKDWLPWLCSALTIWMTWLQGEMRPMGWIVGLVNQLLWLAFAIGMKTYGLLVLNAFLWFMYIRNYRKWRRAEQRLIDDFYGNPLHGLEAGRRFHEAYRPGWDDPRKTPSAGRNDSSVK